MRIEQLTKKFGSVTAVDNIDLETTTQMIGIIGPSGAGKSTFLRMLNRLTPATSGKIIVDGRNILELKGAEKRSWQRDCAMIFQQFNLVPRLDVVTNVMLGGLNRHNLLKSLFNIFGQVEIDRAFSALDRLGIAEQALKRADNLSGGQQQRVAIARALAQEPKMILADEPIASLDPMSAQVVMQSLREINQRDGLPVICNLHTLDTARSYCDRVVGMRMGKIIFDGPPSELTSPVVRDIYGSEHEIDESVTSTSINNTVLSNPGLIDNYGFASA